MCGHCFTAFDGRKYACPACGWETVAGRRAKERPPRQQHVGSPIAQRLNEGWPGLQPRLTPIAQLAAEEKGHLTLTDDAEALLAALTPHEIADLAGMDI